MLNNNRKIKFVSEKEEREFLEKCNNIKYKFAALLQLDCGLRITETINLKVKDFNFQKGELYVKCLKKREKDSKGNIKEVWRTVYLTQRVITTAADYFGELKKKNKSKKRELRPDDWVFPSPSDIEQPITRQQFHRYFQEKSDKRIHPHLLRHTCATKMLENGASLVTVRDVLGHNETRTTEIYVHATEERKRQAAMRLERKNMFKRILSCFWKPRKQTVHILPTNFGWTKYHVGRKAELALLAELTTKKVNMLVIGKQGTGKSHLLDNFQHDKVLRIDDTTKFKTTLAGMLLKILNEDKEQIRDLLNYDESIITKESTKRLCELLCQVTEPNEYTIVIDSAERLTPSVIAALELLRNHFHFVVAARQIEVKAATWLTNFQKIELKPLNRAETLELIVKASDDFRDRIEDFEQFKNHIWQKTVGIPQFVLEMIDRFRKEDFVSRAMVANIEHTAGRKEIDLTLVIVISLASLMILRYLAGEMGGNKDAYKLIGGVAMLFALFGRQIYKAARRKYV